MLQTALKTDQGPREGIEDAGSAFTVQSHVGPSRPLTILGIYDGVGGKVCGEIASGIANLQTAATLFWLYACQAHIGYISSDVIIAWLKQALEAANQAIIREAAKAPERAGMATTAVVAVIYGGKLHVAWLGDSRCYVYHAGTLERVTRDHSEAQELIEAGICTPEEAQQLPCAHIITRCLGQNRPLEIDTLVVPLTPDALVALVTDGLTDVINDRQLAVILQNHCTLKMDLSSLADRLVNSAMQAGTQDNTSVLLFCEQPDERPLAHSDRTQTGGYPVRRAQALRRLTKEKPHVRSAQPLLFE